MGSETQRVPEIFGKYKHSAELSILLWYWNDSSCFRAEVMHCLATSVRLLDYAKAAWSGGCDLQNDSSQSKPCDHEIPWVSMPETARGDLRTACVSGQKHIDWSQHVWYRTVLYSMVNRALLINSIACKECSTLLVFCAPLNLPKRMFLLLDTNFTQVPPMLQVPNHCHAGTFNNNMYRNLVACVCDEYGSKMNQNKWCMPACMSVPHCTTSGLSVPSFVCLLVYVVY